MKLKILSLQFKSQSNKEKNLDKLEKLFKENADFKPDIVILPEYWSVGTDYNMFQTNAEFIPSQTTMLLCGLAKNYNTNIIGGSIIEKTSDNKFYNTCMVFNREGAIIGKYRKNHTFSHCGNKEGEILDKGDEICTVDIENVKFGIGLCYDIRFPEFFRKMIKEGVEVFAIPAAFPQERIEQWELLTRARALENLSYLIFCNQFGSSNCISPYGKVLNISKQGEIALKYSIDINEVKNARENTPFLKDIN